MTILGQVAVVTGGAVGIGAAVCRRLAAAGATVVAADIDMDAAQQLAADHERVHALELDVTDAAAVETAVQTIVATHGRLDVLVNNAGSGTREEYGRLLPRLTARAEEVEASGTATTPLDATVSLTDDQWHRIMRSHLDGTFYCTRAALRTMGPQGSGVIVNIASVCGVAGCEGAPHYSAAKAAILGFTRSVAKEVITQGVRVNAIAPGWVDTPRLAYLGEDALQRRRALTPAGRLGRAEEIAAAVAFLISDDAAYFVGATLQPNGGVVTV